MVMPELHRCLIRVATQLAHKRIYQQSSHTLWLVNNLILLLFAMPADAQLRVVADGSTATTMAGSADCTSTCFITGNSVAGDNLFHSFSEFSIPEGVAVIFNDGGAANIFTRVSNPTQASSILGNLVVGPGDANFFLINPAGITFGPNAELSLNGGSFVATTAERINFSDNEAFIAGTASEPVTLTVSTPTGLQFGSNAAPIVNQSQTVSNTNTLGAPAGLFNPFSTLALIGGELTLQAGNLTAPGGNIVLGSVSPGSEVGLSPTDQGFGFSYDAIAPYQNIQISDSLIDVGGPGGGQINLQSDAITLDNSGIFGVTFGPFEGGDLNIHASQLALNNSAIQGITFSPVRGPDVNLRIDALSLTNGSVLSAETQGPGDSGHLNVQGRHQTHASTVALNASGLGTEVGAGATGQGGNVLIKTEILHLQNSAGIVANTFGPGNGGNLHITATAEFSLENASSLETIANEFWQDPSAPSGVGIFTADVGNAGNIWLTTDRLTVKDGSQIQATIFGNAGNGGHINVKATTVTLAGESTNGQSSGILSQVEPGQTTGHLSNSQGGNILLEAQQLSLSDSAVMSATAIGAGTAGNITLRDLDLLEITGSDTRTSGLFVIGQGAGQAGEIEVTADHIRLVSRAQITASTATTDGGNVTLRGVENIILRDTSRISARAGNGGSGGNIFIETPFLIAMPGEDSDIIATAVNGPGGNIQITASSILGLLEGRAIAANNTNDIDASSQFGTDGTVIINRSEAEPDQGLTNLPQGLADLANQVDESCGTSVTSIAGKFTITGRGGLPPTPEATIRERQLFADFGDGHQSTEQTADISEVVRSHPSPEPSNLIEAQSWITGTEGEIILTSQNTHQAYSNSHQCRQS